MQAVLAFIQRFWEPIKKLFGFLVDVDNVPTTPTLPPVVTNLPTKPTTTTTVEVQSNEQRDLTLKTFYDNTVEPGVTFKVFHLRVTYFGWGMKEALAAPSSACIQLNDKQYTSSEIYSSCKNPAVSFITFERRMKVYGWNALKALTQPLAVPGTPKVQ